MMPTNFDYNTQRNHLIIPEYGRYVQRMVEHCLEEEDKEKRTRMARAIVPSHTLLDGDLVFAAATGAKPLTDPIIDSFQIGHAAAICLARAIARAVYLARSEPGDLQPSWQSRFGPDRS